MKINHIIKILILFSWITISCQDNRQIASEPVHPKNVILLIGDGMGLTQLQAAMTVNGNSLNIERCTNIGLSKTSSASDYITDSAAGGTAISCGIKTNNGAIGVDSKGAIVKSILEYAEEAGLATGLVATSTITHATPASFIAHEASRNSYEAIALDFMDVDVDVFIGGGLDNFNARKDGIDLVDQLKQNGYQIALTIDEMQSVITGKLAGLLNKQAMPKMTEGRGDMLLKASNKAIEILDKNEKGFFLMIEGSQIDWGGHANDTEYVVTELLDFDEVVGAALDFAELDGNTLVIVTADHETGGLSILGEDILGDSLATNFSTNHHTSVMVPVYTFGPQAETFSAIYENNTIFDKMMDALSLSTNN
jgi:alkaline phosphatase